MHILIIDDHDLFRKGLASALQELSLGTSISESASIASARSEIASLGHNLDLVLLDHKLPDGYGSTLLRELRQNYPLLPVAMLSAQDDPELMRSILDMGALGFIPKSTSTPVLIEAIQLILSGGIYIPPSLRSYMQKRDSSEPSTRLLLTPRQQEVLLLLLEGLSNKEIARRIGVSDVTVKSHVTAILKSQGVSSRSKLLAGKCY